MYGIMRIEKRGRSDVYGIQLEANRTREQHEEKGLEFDRSDIDWAKTNDNIHLVKTEKWNEAITSKLKDIEAQTGKKTRKDAVVMLDCVFTASPEFFESKTADEIKEYFENCLQFYIKEYCQGDASRVLNAVIHLDETTPHMQVASVPILTSEVGDRLNAKTIMGGRADYRRHQDRFYDEVSSKYGLERGEVREPAAIKAHTTKREWQLATQDELIKEQTDVINKNKTVLDRQISRYKYTKEQLENAKAELEDAAEKVEALTAEAVDNVKVKKVSDLFNSDTITVDRKSWESLQTFKAHIENEVKTIHDADNISKKKAELTKVNNELTKAKTELSIAEHKKESVADDYEYMTSELKKYRSQMDIIFENSRLQRENEKLRAENSKLRQALNSVKEYIEARNIPEPIKEGLKKIINKISEVEQQHQKPPHRGLSR